MSEKEEKLQSGVSLKVIVPVAVILIILGIFAVIKLTESGYSNPYVQDGSRKNVNSRITYSAQNVIGTNNSGTESESNENVNGSENHNAESNESGTGSTTDTTVTPKITTEPTVTDGATGTGDAGNSGNNGNSGTENSGNNSSSNSGSYGNVTAANPTATPRPTNTGNTATASGTPVSVHGKLSVNGSQLVDKNGNPFQLKGVSTHGIAWFPEYVNKAAFTSLRDEWGCNVVRLAMYTAEYGGYCSGGNKEDLKQLVNNGVSYATDLGMYVIIDWHILSDSNPNTNKSEAIAFFNEMSKKYADYNNVIYEICNEPNGGTSWSTIKSYANEVIATIRANDKDAIIIVGTPTWSQDVDQAAASPITGYSNIMYALHFYADTHTDWLRNRMVDAINKGLPVFVTEYGICDASGNGACNIQQANSWVEIMDKYGVSYVCWNLANKAESSSQIKSSVSKTSGWTYNDLSTEGQWLVDTLGGSIAQYTSGAKKSTTSGNSSNSGSSGNTGNTGNTGSSTGNAQTPTKVPTPTPTKAPAQQQQQNQNQPTQPTQPTAEPVKSGSSGNVKASTNPSTPWYEGDKQVNQYEIALENTNSNAISTWTITITFSSNIELTNSWCGKFSVKGNTLTITPEDYNSEIAANSQISSKPGFQVKGSNGFTVSNIIISY